jgi:hypothetical protein
MREFKYEQSIGNKNNSKKLMFYLPVSKYFSLLTFDHDIGLFVLFQKISKYHLYILVMAYFTIIIILTTTYFFSICNIFLNNMNGQTLRKKKIDKYFDTKGVVCIQWRSVCSTLYNYCIVVIS